MYLDRIFAPEKMVGLQYTPFKNLKDFICMNCERVLAVPFVYQKERRPSFRLFEGSVRKRITKNSDKKSAS